MLSSKSCDPALPILLSIWRNSGFLVLASQICKEKFVLWFGLWANRRNSPYVHVDSSRPLPPPLPIARQPLVGVLPHWWGFTITLRHTTLLWTSDQPDTETYTWQHKTVTGERHPRFGGIRTRYPNKRATADPRLRPRDHWDRPYHAP